MNNSPIRLSSPYLRYFAMASDVVIIWLVGYVTCQLYPVTLEQSAMPQRYQMLVFVASLLFLLFASNLYRSWRVNELGAILWSICTVWTGTVMMLVIGLFVIKGSDAFSRVWLLSWFLGVLWALIIERFAVYATLRALRARGYNYKTVLLVGDSPSVKHVKDALEQSAWSGMRLVATVMPDQLANYLAKLKRVTRPIDEVWLCLRRSDDTGIRTVLHTLRHSTANIRLVPDWFTLGLLNHGVSEVVGIQMLDMSVSPMTGSVRVAKAIQDFVLGTLILLLISPLMLAIGVAVKLTSSGPIIFRQQRYGWNGEVISIYKFRSMVVHTEIGHELSQATKNDTRVTPLGAFLRRTSLDELPQFINVMQGRMSIVGPRPHAVQHNEYYKDLVPKYMLRHKVKPGITGWAQVNGFRGETDTLDKMTKRVKYDLHYIEHLTLSLDLKIIIITIFKGFINKNAF